MRVLLSESTLILIGGINYKRYSVFNFLIKAGIVCWFKDKTDPVVTILACGRINIWVQFPITKIVGLWVSERKRGLFIFLEGNFCGLSHFNYFRVMHNLHIFLVAKEGKGNTLTYFPRNVWLDLQLFWRPRSVCLIWEGVWSWTPLCLCRAPVDFTMST